MSHDDDDYFLAPATDRLLVLFQYGMEHFKGFPLPDAMSKLSMAGIVVLGWDLLQLQVAFRTFHGFPSLHFSKEAVDREKQISDLCERLLALLEVEQDGWRTYWGDVDWRVYDKTMEAPEPAAEVEVPALMETLADLKKAADERLEWLDSTKNFEIDPGNRAGRIRYFYWLLLMAFWKFQLLREIGTSTSEGKDAYGPLIKFIQVMSARGMSSEERQGDTIRAFIRRHKGREDRFAHMFTPSEGYRTAWAMRNSC
ncbi:hypothetical protein [Mesorhizobium sp. M1143]|uniref:hypothetical protein n=1 Tax=Mesorhizobium sp. M1143 TaxID=2957061 RepID=UPI0033350BA1